MINHPGVAEDFQRMRDSLSVELKTRSTKCLKRATSASNQVKQYFVFEVPDICMLESTLAPETCAAVF